MHLTNYHFYSPKNYLYIKPVKGLQGCGMVYRFAFNGQEKDDEVSGAGNTMTATFWEYDVRLGRRFNLDPKPNEWESHYAVMGDNPICYNDIFGDKWKKEKDCETAKRLDGKLDKKKNGYGKLSDKYNKKADRAARNGNSENENKWRAMADEYYKGKVTMSESQRHIKAMETSSIVFTFEDIGDSEKSITYMESDNTVVMQINGENDAIAIHEIEHGYDHLYGNSQQLPGENGKQYYSDVTDEMRAYTAQYFFNTFSITDHTNSVIYNSITYESTVLKIRTSKDITPDWVFGLYNSGGNKVYPNLPNKGLNPIYRPNSNASKESHLMYQFRFSKIPFIKQ
jgi:hypothetical protein